jgi:hypothetical protein
VDYSLQGVGVTANYSYNQYELLGGAHRFGIGVNIR